MKRSKRLNPVLELAESREKQTAQVLGDSRRKLESTQRNLDSLKTFRDNYSSQFQRSGNEGLGTRQLVEYRAFLAKINTAIADQEKAVTTAQAELQSRQAEWEAARNHSLGIKKVFENTLTEEKRMEEKKQQAEQDERSGRRSSGGNSILTVFV
ncbi:flagellar export protein FliJ [Methylocaldum sp.]|uniref:flagellar export protein FliJ n=1 Tax=Methylocaldum sp. TaxID=1969727 RepID=UPI002D6AB39B|nr:flagellar export protein FliJ [Methylocaldum sp.]HYE37821.1 flagellar export protein FliJ [Methylocaldum sp.]